MQTFGKKSPKVHANKIYEGTYEFYRHSNLYSEETFEVYRDNKDHTYNFIALLHSRLSTGEVLNMHLDYIVSKDFIPLKVQIQKKLRDQTVNEYFIYDSSNSRIHYRFAKDKYKKDLQMITPPKFHIATSFACTSMLFTKSKKIDNNITNTYHFIISNNLWEYKHPLTSKTIALDSVSSVSEVLNIDGNDVASTQYRLYEYNEAHKKKSPSSKETDEKNATGAVQVHMSHHMGIPYIINENNNTKMQIKYLQNLEKTLS